MFRSNMLQAMHYKYKIETGLRMVLMRLEDSCPEARITRALYSAMYEPTYLHGDRVIGAWC